MDLTFQVSMQHCSFQHWIILPPPEISTTECNFHFGPATSLFLKLLVIALHSSLVACWAPSNLGLGGFIFWRHIFLPFHTVHGVLKARILEWFAIPSSSGPRFVRTPHYDPSFLGCMAWLIASLSYASPFTTTRL